MFFVYHNMVNKDEYMAIASKCGYRRMLCVQPAG